MTRKTWRVMSVLLCILANVAFLIGFFLGFGDAVVVAFALMGLAYSSLSTGVPTEVEFRDLEKPIDTNKGA